MDIGQIVAEIIVDVEPHRTAGRVADYIPALARVDPRNLAIAVATVDGAVVSAGEATKRFSIQSVSKVFMLALAAAKAGPDLWVRVGREPSGSAFNSIVQLEHEHGIPRNPFINAGAIVTADVCLDGSHADAAVAALLGFIRKAAADDSIEIDAEVAASEAATGFRNRALAHFMRAEGNLRNDPDSTLSVYFRQCAVAMNCVQLARAGLFLAARGMDPVRNERIVPADRARRINALMLTCGHYDASGDFAFRVGLPGKSGVGGGILAIAPGKAAIAVWSPGLNENGNSLAGSLMLEQLALRTGWSVFA